MDRRLSAPLSLLVAGVLLLAGCTSPAGPEPSLSASETVSSPEPSPSPTVTLTQEEILLAQIPEEAKGDDLLAAVEMAKFFITLHPGLYQGGDRELFEWLSLPECEFCSSSLEVTAERVARGEIQIGGEGSIPEQVEQSVLDIETDNTTTALVGFELVEAPHTTVDAEGAEIRSSDGGTYQVSVALRHVDGLWRVYGTSVD